MRYGSLKRYRLSLVCILKFACFNINPGEREDVSGIENREVNCTDFQE